MATNVLNPFASHPFPSSPLLQTAPRTADNDEKYPNQRQTSKPKAQAQMSRQNGVTKPKQTKSRNGCVTCKNKRLKCDETKPTCQNCKNRNVPCGGYHKELKWRTLDGETFNSTKPPAPPRAKKNNQVAAQYPSQQSPSSSEGSGSTTSPAAVPNTPQTTISTSFHSPVDSKQSRLSHFRQAHESFQETSSSMIEQGDTELSAFVTLANVSFASPTNRASRCGKSGDVDEGRTRPSDLLVAPVDPSKPGNHNVFEFDEQLLTTGFLPIDDQPDIMEQEEVEEIKRDLPLGTDLIRAQSPTLSSSRSESPTGDVPSFHISQLKLALDSPEMLLVNFDHNTCGILSVRNGPTENPWRTMIWPIATGAPALYHAIASMSAFHKSTTRPEMKLSGLYHVQQSLQSLRSGLCNGRVDVALATSLALAFAESWDVHVKTGIQHLHGGRTLVNRALMMLQQNQESDANAARIRFLCNTWLYMDVIARLTSLEADDRTEIDMALWSQIDPQGTSPEIDPLMGCATTLFPIIGRVGNLVRQVRRSAKNSLTAISRASRLKADLEQWIPPDYLHRPEDPDCAIQHSIQTAQAYRWATLLYLHQAVPEVPSRSSGKLAYKALSQLASVPVTSRTVIVHIYPLLAAGCEASSDDDRTWVKERWISMSRRMQIGNIDKCLEVVEEVWKRRDWSKAEVARPRRNSSMLHRGDFMFQSPLQDARGLDPDESGESWGLMSQGLDQYQQDDIQMLQDVSTKVEAGNSSPVEACQLPSTFGEWPGQASVDPMRRFVKPSMSHPRRDSVDVHEELDYERTVRGRQHWVGVMRDWNWEVLLG